MKKISKIILLCRKTAQQKSSFASLNSKPPRFDLANKLVEEKEMKNDKKIDVRMYAVENDKAAFVEVSVIDVDAKEHVGLFLVDSGCTSNKLSTSIKMMVGDKSQLIRTLKTQTVGNQIVEEEVFSFPFTIGGCHFVDEFTLIEENLLTGVGDKPILGILGNPFLRNNSLVIDFGSHRIYTSEVSLDNLSFSDFSYFFPMVPGLESYGVPVVPIMGDDGGIFAMVDTGCTDLLVAEGALEKISGEIKYNGKTTEMHSIAGTMNCRDGNLSFSIIGLQEQNEGLKKKEYPFLETVTVAPVKSICSLEQCQEKEGEEIPDVGVLLGSPFIASTGWILDFGANIIYRRK